MHLWKEFPFGIQHHITGILQAIILEWVAMPSSLGSSQPRDQTCISYVSCIGRQVLYSTTWEAPIYLRSPEYCECLLTLAHG